MIPRLVNVGLATSNEGKFANIVGRSSLGLSVGQGMHSTAMRLLSDLPPTIMGLIYDWDHIVDNDPTFFCCLIMVTGHFDLHAAADAVTTMMDVSNYNSLHQSIVDLSNNLAVQVQRESADISLLSQNLVAQISQEAADVASLQSSIECASSKYYGSVR